MRETQIDRSQLVQSFDDPPQQLAMPSLNAQGETPAVAMVPRSANTPPTPHVTRATAIPDPEVVDIRQDDAKVGGWISFVGNLAALAWVAAGVAVPLSYFGLTGLMAMHPALQAVLFAITFGPAMILMLGAAAASEAARARVIASNLSEHGPSEPVYAAQEQAARRLGETVREEIGLLNTTIERAMARMAELETLTSRSTGALDDILDASHSGTQRLAENIELNRLAFAELTQELNTQTDSMSGAVGRQIRLMRETSRLVQTEYQAADGMLRTHYDAFRSSAEEMRAHTSAFDQSAIIAKDAADELTTVIADALEQLTRASTLTDAARQSAAEATMAANATASAVRETTSRAVQDAKRAAEMIRAEAAAAEDSAHAVLERLQAVAQAARDASAEAQAAADHHATTIERRLAGLANTAKTERNSAPTPRAAPIQRDVLPRPEPRSEPRYEPREDRLAGRGGWSNLTPPGLEALSAPERQRTAPSARNHADVRHEVMDALLMAGIRPVEVLTPNALDQISRRARAGASPRRQAVEELAGSTVDRLARALAQSPADRAAAQAFRANPELATDEAAARRLGYAPGELISAYLLVDAALG